MSTDYLSGAMGSFGNYGIISLTKVPLPSAFCDDLVPSGPTTTELRQANVEFPNATNYLPLAPDIEEQYWNIGDGTSLKVTAQIDLKKCIIKLTLSGILNNINLLHCVASLRMIPECQQGFRVLYDTSAVLSSTITAQCIRTWAHYSEEECNKIAIIAPTSYIFGMARMYELSGNWSEGRVGVFKDGASAMQWLEQRTS